MRRTLAATRVVGGLASAATLCSLLLAVQAAAAPPAGLTVAVEQGDGTVTTGRLERIDAAGVHLAEVDGGAVSLPADRVRSVRRTAGQNAAPAGRPRLVLTLSDGSTLSGDDFAWDGKQPAVLLRPEGRIELPASRVRSIAWLPETAAVDGVVPWQAAMPEGTEKDLVIVGTAENHEFVECAIAGVSADAVTVVLEEETIPVKRAKVIGLQWLRGEPAPTAAGTGPAVLTVTGGVLRAGRVDWSAEGLVVDGELRLPSAMLIGVDYAAGRIVRLASLMADKVEVEPWFGGLVRTAGRNDALSAFFAPRTVGARGIETVAIPADATRADGGTAEDGIVMRPRTVSVWRLPPDSRRFRTVVESVAAGQAADATLVVVAVDDRELFRRQIGGGADTGGADRHPVGELPGAGIPIDVDVSSGRRLTVTVDFGADGGVGGAVRFTNPVIER